MLVLDARRGQIDFQKLLIEVRVTSGSGIAADVSEHLDVKGSESRDEYVERMRGVAYGPDFEFGLAHEKVIGRLRYIGSFSLGVHLRKHHLF